MGATLGLLAFILAFTFGIASSRYDARKELVLADANAIGTCFLRTEFLPAPERQQAQRLLREYTTLRAQVLSLEPAQLGAFLTRSKEIQTELWRIAVEVGNAQPSPMTALFAAACNDVFDIHEERVTKGLESRIPPAVWLILYLVALISMLGVGYQVGLADDRRSLGSAFLFVTFSTVLALIADLDDSYRGFIQVDQRPLQKLAAELGDPN